MDRHLAPVLLFAIFALTLIALISTDAQIAGQAVKALADLTAIR